MHKNEKKKIIKLSGYFCLKFLFLAANSIKLFNMGNVYHKLHCLSEVLYIWQLKFVNFFFSFFFSFLCRYDELSYYSFTRQ